MPRVGGLGLMAAALPVAAALGDAPIAILMACAAALVLVSAADDVRSLPISVRLPAHIGAATVAVLAIASPSAAHAGLDVVESAVAILSIVWMTNLFNFMDGSDGLAGGMALIGFGTLALAAALAGEWPLALACAAIASASAGFLAHNLPPARVFLGDAGSIPLGFLAGALGLHGVMTGAWPLALPLAAFSPFILDASATLLRRILRREPFWKAHRSHYYQRLVLAGLVAAPAGRVRLRTDDRRGGERAPHAHGGCRCAVRYNRWLGGFPRRLVRRNRAMCPAGCDLTTLVTTPTTRTDAARWRFGSTGLESSR